jgi:uncharacterized sulfatase
MNALAPVNITILLSLLAAPVARAQNADLASSPAKDRRPNIVLIVADDLGYGDLGCYGQRQIKTPHLDRLAAEGMRFTQAYAGATVCAPSRCVLMTGLHIGHARVRGLDPPYLPGLYLQRDDVTVAEVLHDAGYATGMIGKWGLGIIKPDWPSARQGLPWRQGFDYFFGYLTHGHAHNYYPDFLWRNNAKFPLANKISPKPQYKGLVADTKVEYAHDVLADDALKFIRDHQQAPFFLYLCFTIPHANNEAGAEGMEVPDYGQYAATDWPDPEKGKAAMISRMDGDVGRLLALLEELQLDGNTLVMFTSDNGPPAAEGGRLPEFNDSNGPLRGFKGDLWEGGIRVPMIARWPGHISAGKTSEFPVYFADMMSTLAAVSGGKAPEGIDGVDFSPTLEGHDQPELFDRFMYWEFDKNGLQRQAARWRNWKAVKAPYTSPIQLYDLSTDLGEQRDVAADHPDLVAKFDNYIRRTRRPDPNWPVEAQPPRSNKSKNTPAAL